LHTNTHASSRIRTHDPSVQAREDNTSENAAAVISINLTCSDTKRLWCSYCGFARRFVTSSVYKCRNCKHRLMNNSCSTISCAHSNSPSGHITQYCSSPISVGHSVTCSAPKSLPVMSKVSVGACNFAELAVTASCLPKCLPSWPSPQYLCTALADSALSRQHCSLLLVVLKSLTYTSIRTQLHYLRTAIVGRHAHETCVGFFRNLHLRGSNGCPIINKI
jgi:hypothetical protein